MLAWLNKLLPNKKDKPTAPEPKEIVIPLVQSRKGKPQRKRGWYKARKMARKRRRLAQRIQRRKQQ